MLSSTAIAAGASPAQARAADSLYRRALGPTAAGDVTARKTHLRELEEAARLDPRRADIRLALGRACLTSGQPDRGRAFLAGAAALAPDDVEIQVALGAAWRWEWLSSLDPKALASARECLAHAVEIAPTRADANIELAALEIIHGRSAAAAELVRRVSAGDSLRGEALLAIGCAEFRLGHLAASNVAFVAAPALLPTKLRRHFVDVDWMLDAADPAARDVHARDVTTAGAFWRDQDPDLTTPENEAQLDFESRLALALLLFRDANGVRWDQRTELFVRYGPPAAIEPNPITHSLDFQSARRYESPTPAAESYAPPPIEYPFDVQVWSYPELGLRFDLWDQTLTQSYRPAIAYEPDFRSQPSAEALAERPDLADVGSGFLVLHTMPPNLRPIRARGIVSRYPLEHGVRLVAGLEAPGAPGDSLWASCAVAAADGRIVSRERRLLSISACDPAEFQFGDFAIVVPPGDYRVDLAVDDGHGGRGRVRLGAACVAAAAPLALSDVVLLCGGESSAIGASGVRIEPNIDRRVSGSRPISVYFEIDHLSAGADGSARFAYTYTVQRLREDAQRPDRQAQPAIQATREETNVGTLRRQFVTIPVRTLAPGIYRVAIEVRDLVAQSEARAELRFTRE